MAYEEDERDMFLDEQGGYEDVYEESTFGERLDDVRDDDLAEEDMMAEEEVIVVSDPQSEFGESLDEEEAADTPDAKHEATEDEKTDEEE